VDLKPGQEEILRKFRDKTRQYIRRAIKEGIEVRTGGVDDLPAYYDLMRKTGRREGFAARTRAYYETEWQTFAKDGHGVLLMAYYQDLLLAVRTVHCFGKHAAEFHGGSAGKYQHLYPNHLLVWEGINWAKARGCESYDLWGIPDEIMREAGKERILPVSERRDGLWGVYRFKTGFSKNLVCYIGAYDYVYQPFPYLLITNRFLNKLDIRERIVAWMDSIRHK
jgi:lipid II:glycine glycyltransferase (peptidoglycan interpeptide bridge formation enzyme)